MQIQHAVEEQTISRILQPIEQSLSASTAESDSAESSKAASAGSLVTSAVLSRVEEIVQQCMDRAATIPELHAKYRPGPLSLLPFLPAAFCIQAFPASIEALHVKCRTSTSQTYFKSLQLSL